MSRGRRASLRAAVLALCLALSGGAWAADETAPDKPANEKTPAPAKKDYTDAEFEADSAACRAEAQFKIFGPDGDGKRSVTVAQAVERDGVYKVTRDLVMECMTKKGY